MSELGSESRPSLFTESQGCGGEDLKQHTRFTDEKAVTQNGQVICLGSHSKVVKERRPALWTECFLPMGSEAFVCVLA